YGDHKFDLAKAVGNCSQQKPVILLAHQPKAAKIALDSSYRIDLVLSGHTHGGQMFPMVIAAYLLNPFFAGLYKYGPNGSFVYVSQGTQYWGIPMRIATTMEITRITLQSAN
ncbi:transmembrane protein with metallophosphoesterase domain, partial [Biomphalaria glabrata]